MANLLNMLSEDVFAEKMDVQNVLLAAIAGHTGGLRFSTYADIRQLVRLGLHKLIFHVGDQLIVEKETALTATIGHTEESGGITAASVDPVKFLDALGTAHNGEYEFTHNGAEWHFKGEPVQLAAYGITVTGTAKAGDEVLIHETTSELVFDVIGIDKDIPADDNYTHSLTLQLHDCFIALQFDAREALFVFPDGLAAGSYHFTVNAQPWFADNVGKVITFTLTKAIPAGGQLVVNNAYNATMIGATISSFASNAATTATETVTMSAGSAGTDLGGVAAALTGDNTNSIHRALLGSNNWRESAARQYLNSDKAAGSVWTPQTKFDRPPSWVSNTAGFMYGLDKDFISSLGKVKKTTVLNNITDGGIGEDSEELIFLLSRSEVYGTAEKAGVDEGGVYDYYKNATNEERIKLLNGSARIWWLRTPNVGNANYVRSVNTSGALSHGGANLTLGLAPACCII